MASVPRVRVSAACLATLLVAASVLAGFAGTDVFLPMVGRQAGVYPSNWYTTVWVYNPGTAAATARVFFLERGTANPTPPYVDVLVAPGDTERLDNVVETYFHVQKFGAIRVTSDTGKLVVTSRVFSKGPGGGDRDSVGQDFAAVPASFALGNGESTQILGVWQTSADTAVSDFRYNFGAVETTGHSASIRFTAYDGNNQQLGTTTVGVSAFSQGQWVYKDRFPSGLVDNARLEAQVVSGSGRVIVYGSQIANGSQDPTTFEMQYKDSLLGITNVQHDATLTGDGTAAAPLGLADGAVGAAKLAAAGGTNGQVLATDGAKLYWQTAGDITAVWGSGGLIGGHDSGEVELSIADGGVSKPKLSASGGTAGQALGTDGAALRWQDDGLRLPFSGTATNAQASLTIANTGAGDGIKGQTSSASASGVYGESTSPTGTGVIGSGARGVQGWSNANQDGVYGSSSGGWGVHGKSTSGDGVYGEAGAQGHNGVFGINTANGNWGYIGGNTGAYGQSVSGTGVVGISTSNNGVSGSSTSAEGVKGTANGAAAGVLGSNTSTGNGVTGTAQSGYGVYGQAYQNGVYGVATASSGVGVYGKCDVGSNATGVVGYSAAHIGLYGSGPHYGVYAVTSSGRGVYGESSSGTGVEGTSSSAAGVRGTSSSGNGLYGSSSSNDAVYGSAGTSGKAGIFGTNSSTGTWGYIGGNVAVYGNSSDTAGYFQGKLTNTNLAGSGNRLVYADSNGTLTNSSSDVRLKRDIAPLAEDVDVLAALATLRGVKFNWDPAVERARHLGEQREIGMIAQEVETVLPELVGVDKDGYETLDYAKLSAFLVEVAKAQQAEIREQAASFEAQIQAQAARLETMQGQLQALEGRGAVARAR